MLTFKVIGENVVEIVGATSSEGFSSFILYSSLPLLINTF